MTLRTLVFDIAVMLRDGLVYGEDAPGLRSRMLNALELATTLKAKLDEADAPKSVRFCLYLPAHDRQSWDSRTNEYTQGASAREVYVIDGFVTESKILAIKEVRANDNSGLKEAKDIVDALQAKPVSGGKLF